MGALMMAGVTLLALWGVIRAARRRAERRVAEAAARARARRRMVPVVSSNLRGQPARGSVDGRDLWAETAAGSPRPGPQPLTPAAPEG